MFPILRPRRKTSLIVIFLAVFCLRLLHLKRTESFSSTLHFFLSEYLTELLLMSICFWTVVLEKTIESPLVCKEIKPVNPKGNQSWIFIERTDIEAEMLTLWPLDVKNWLIWKDPDSEKDWRWEKGTTEDETVGWHHWLNGHDLSKLWELVMGREACCTAIHGVAKSWTWLSDSTELTHF